MKKLLFILVVLLCMASADAQRGKLEAFVGTLDAGYNYWLFTPSDSQVDEPKPLVVFLHGASLCGSNIEKVRRYGPLSALSYGLWIDAYILAPQNPGGAWKPKRVNNCVDWAVAHCNVDTNRIYVLGMSLGGYGTFDYVADYSYRVAAAMPICGGANPSNYCSMNDLPMWIVHGSADRAVPISQAQHIIGKMQQCDPTLPRLLFTQLPGIDHGFPARLFYLRKTYDWLFEHSLTDTDRRVCRNYEFTIAEMRNAYHMLKRGSVTFDVVKHGPSYDAPSSNEVAVTSQNSGKKSKATASGKKQGKATSGGKNVYKVRKGDTLSEIAQRHGTTVTRLCQLNGLTRKSVLQIGQTIKLR